MPCISREESSLLDLLGRDAAVRRGRVDVVVSSPGGETITVIAGEAEVRFALGLLPGTSLPSPTQVAARLAGDLPGDVTLSLNIARRPVAPSEADRTNTRLNSSH